MKPLIFAIAIIYLCISPHKYNSFTKAFLYTLKVQPLSCTPSLIRAHLSNLAVLVITNIHIGSFLLALHPATISKLSFCNFSKRLIKSLGLFCQSPSIENI